MNEKSSLPAAFVERLEKIIPPEHFTSVLASFSVPRRASFRLQKPGIPSERVRKELELAGIPFTARSAGTLDIFQVARSDVRRLQETALYRQSALYIQGLSSMEAVRMLDPRPGQRILDMAAAPGSKTTLIALSMKGQGELVANEKNRPRFFRLKAVVEAQGMGHVRLTMKPGEKFGREEPEAFDAVLLDAPCSSEGKFQAGVPESFGYWKPRKIHEMARVQKKLLLSAFAALKPGGRLLYSTCTFAPEENEAVIGWGLGKFGEAARVESLEPAVPPERLIPGLGSWGDEIYPEDVRKSVRILPDSEYEGFFMCSIRKAAPWRLEERKGKPWEKRRSSR